MKDRVPTSQSRTAHRDMSRWLRPVLESVSSVLKNHLELSDLELDRIVKELSYILPDGAVGAEVEEKFGTDSEDDSDDTIGASRTRVLQKPENRLKAFMDEMLRGKSFGSALSHLELESIKAPSRKLYRMKLDEFFAWCTSCRLPLLGARQVEQALVAYFNDCYQNGKNSPIGEQTAAALAFFVPDFKVLADTIPRSLRCLKGWRRLRPARSKRPWPWAVWAGLAVLVMEMTDPTLAVAVLIGVDLYLRISELLSIRCGQLQAPTTQGVNSWSIQLYPQTQSETTKTGQQDETVAADSNRLRWMSSVFAAISTKPLEEKRVRQSYPEVLSAFAKAARRLGVKITPGEMRQSGPSIDRAMNLRSNTEVAKRGRWAALGSVRRYEKKGRLNESWKLLPQRSQDFCLRCEQDLERLILFGDNVPTL